MLVQIWFIHVILCTLTFGSTVRYKTLHFFHDTRISRNPEQKTFVQSMKLNPSHWTRDKNVTVKPVSTPGFSFGSQHSKYKSKGKGETDGQTERQKEKFAFPYSNGCRKEHWIFIAPEGNIYEVGVEKPHVK